MGSLQTVLAQQQALRNGAGGGGSSGQRVCAWLPEMDYRSFGDLQAIMINICPDPTKVFTTAKLFPQGNPGPIAMILFEAFNAGHTDMFSHVEGLEEFMAQMSTMQNSESYANYSGIDSSGGIISYSGDAFSEDITSSAGGVKRGGGGGIGVG